MKIAVVMYGQLRWHEVARETFNQNFLPAFKGHDVKYFAHFWSDKPDLEYNKSVDNPNRLTDFHNTYNPNSVVITQPLTIPEIMTYFDNKIDKMSPNLLNQIYSLNQSFDNLEKYKKETGEEFDLYIKMRTDVAYLEPINLDNFDDNSIYFCKNIWGQSMSEYATCLLLFTKHYQNFKTFCKMGFSFDEILKRLIAKENIPGVWGHEYLNANHINHNHIQMKCHNFKIDLARHLEAAKKI